MVRAANVDLIDSTAEGEQMLECDYLVIGAGATSLAFVDSLLGRMEVSKRSISVIIVDERDEPGGHWNDAYRFARLHHESKHYGVSSKALEKPCKAKNAKKGSHYATTVEILAYYGSVMDDFVDSGSVQYFPLCSYRDEQVVSLVDQSRVWKVSDACKIVDSTFMRIVAPSARGPPFDVGLGAFVVPPNYLSSLTVPASKYVIIGAGRTGIDTILRLLSRGVEPSAVQWIMPRDHWFMCREAIDGKQVMRTSREFLEATQYAATLTELGVQLERRGLFCRLDSNRKQECFHGAAVSVDELAKLRSIEDVVRLGRVRAVQEDHILLERGVVDTCPGTLHVDCTSNWIRDMKDSVPIWQGRRIVLQPVQELFIGCGEFNVPCSAGAIGFIEALHSKEDLKNSMCTPARHPDTIEDWLRIQITANRNRTLWRYPQLRIWLTSDRLSLFSALSPEDFRSLHDPTKATMKKKPADVIEKILQEDKEAPQLEAAKRMTTSAPCSA